nr:hypothetical protein LVJ77_03890 [Conchiformibius kuhniae]
MIKTAMQTDDIIGSVLRTHLTAEQILTAWIYAACNRENFLHGTQLTFGIKLTIADNLGLPEYASKIFRNINKIRNKLAHSGTEAEIDPDLLQSTKDLFHRYIAHTYDPKQQYGISFFDTDGNAEVQAAWNDSEQPPHITLAVMVSLVLCKLAQDSTKLLKINLPPCPH